MSNRGLLLLVTRILNAFLSSTISQPHVSAFLVHEVFL